VVLLVLLVLLLLLLLLLLVLVVVDRCINEMCGSRATSAARHERQREHTHDDDADDGGGGRYTLSPRNASAPSLARTHRHTIQEMMGREGPTCTDTHTAHTFVREWV